VSLTPTRELPAAPQLRLRSNTKGVCTHIPRAYAISSSTGLQTCTKTSLFSDLYKNKSENKSGAKLLGHEPPPLGCEPLLQPARLGKKTSLSLSLSPSLSPSLSHQPPPASNIGPPSAVSVQAGFSRAFPNFRTRHSVSWYGGTSLIRNCLLLGPYSRPTHRALWWS